MGVATNLDHPPKNFWKGSPGLEIKETAYNCMLDTSYTDKWERVLYTTSLVDKG